MQNSLICKLWNQNNCQGKLSKPWPDCVHAQPGQGMHSLLFKIYKIQKLSLQTVYALIRLIVHAVWSGKEQFISARRQIEGWAQDWRKSDGCFSPNLISSPWRRYEDYNISFCKQWKFRCHCSYEQWHLNLHCLQRGPSCP